MKRLIGVVVLTSGLVVFAQQPFQDDSGDAPDHGVARLSLQNGNVSVTHGDTGDMVAAQVNAPLVASDRVLTGEGSRAEIQFDALNMIRLAPMTEVRMGELQYRRFLVQVAQGTVTLRVLRPSNAQSEAQVEISTPNSSVHPLQPGTYRITVHGDGTSEITVREGEAEVFSPTGSEPLRAGTTMMSRGSASDPEFRTTAAIGFDEWDRWNTERDRAFDRVNESSRYVSPDISGAEDLSNHGRWVNDPSYGSVWVPNADPDWAPYRNGRWSYIDYYGWSWVSYDPWGWAPYHYGRWYQGGYGWSWYPGPVASRYYWRPALVGFFGWGSPGFGMSAGFGFGNVGWVPLAPYEPFRPWYGRNSYGNRVTVINNTNIVNVYRNARVNGGVTSLRAGDFGRVPVDNRSYVRAGDHDLTRGGMVNGPLGFGATREGRQFTGRDFNPRGLPSPSGNTRFYSPSAAGFNGPQDRGGWRKFGDHSGGGGARPGGGAVERPRGRGNLGFDGFGGNSSRGNDQQPVQVRSPIVTNRDGFGGERRDQRGGFGGFGGNFGGPRSNPGANRGDGGGSGGRFPQQGGQPGDAGPGGVRGGGGARGDAGVDSRDKGLGGGAAPGGDAGGGFGGGFGGARGGGGSRGDGGGGFGGGGMRGGGGVPRGDSGDGFGGARGGGGSRGDGGGGGGNPRGGGFGGGGGPRGGHSGGPRGN